MFESAFNSYFMCNFSDTVTPKDITYEPLRDLWFKDFTIEQLEHSIKRWLVYDKNLLDFDNAMELLVDCLQIFLTFVKHNFTGPFNEVEECRQMLSNLYLGKYLPFEYLKQSGEEVNPNVKNGELLAIAKTMLENLKKEYEDSVILAWWSVRFACVHQYILDDLADKLYQDFKSSATLLERVYMKWIDNLEDQGLLFVELSNGYLQFHRTDTANKLLNKVCEHLGVTLNIEGLLGLRTKFQQNPLPQLCLKMEHANNTTLPSASETNGQTELPKLLDLESDLRLERIRFLEPKDNEVMTLPSILQTLILSKVKLLKRSQPKDRLADEELEPYTQTLLYQSKGPLQVRQATLLLNCLQESNSRRTVERSWKQCEECVRSLDNVDKYSRRERLSYAFASFLQPKWHIQMQLCDLLRSLGMTKTALDIYLKIQAWPQVIECYTSLELTHKAAQIIRQQIDKKPTALLYCLLGDAENNPQFYERAWEYSKFTSSKSQAYWGNYYFRRNDYAEAIDHFEKSIEINMLQEKILLRYGYCAIQLEQWQKAVHAYISYTHLEPNGFESWNNLAKALIKLGDKQRAYKVLTEALKCNYNNWKVWENFMLVSVDTGHFKDALRAYNRLIELKDDFLDTEVLSIIVHNVMEDVIENNETQPLQKKMIALMADQCAKYSNNFLIWELAAVIACTPMKKADKLIKVYRTYTSLEKDWATQPEKLTKVLNLCAEFSSLSLAAIVNNHDDESEAMITSQLNSARLTVQACINVLNKTPNVAKSEELSDLQKKVNYYSGLLRQHIDERMLQQKGR